MAIDGVRDAQGQILVTVEAHLCVVTQFGDERRPPGR